MKRIYIEIQEAQEALFGKGASYGQCWRSYSWRKLQKHQKQLRLRLPVLPLHQPLYVRPQKLRPYATFNPWNLFSGWQPRGIVAKGREEEAGGRRRGASGTESARRDDEGGLSGPKA